MGSYTQGNDTYACSSSGCQISCASPEFGSNVCYSMQQNFLDGTSCQGGGKCDNGQCKGSSVGKEINSWIHDNRTLVIALASVIGGLIVLAVLSCCISSCRRRSRNRKLKARAGQNVPPSAWNGSNQWNPIPPVPDTRMRGANGGGSNSGRSHGGNSAGWDQNGRWRPPPPTWQPTVRYA